MKPRPFPLILIVSMGILAGLIIHYGIRDHLRPPVAIQSTSEVDDARDVADEQRFDEAAAPVSGE